MCHPGEGLLSVSLVNKTQVATLTCYDSLVRCYLAHACEDCVLKISKHTVSARQWFVCAANKHVALARFCRHALDRTAFFERPDLDMPRAHCDEPVAHPGHAIDVADALVAGVQRRSSGAGMDAPNVQEAILRRSNACEVSRVGTEGDTVDAVLMLDQRCEGCV